MQILLLGAGAIGRALVRATDTMPAVSRVLVFDAVPAAADACLALSKKATPTANVALALAECDLVVEAASQRAVAEFVPAALEAGRDVVVMSVGALADDALRARIEDAARRAGRRVYVPSGAIAGLDGVRAASEALLDEVRLTTAKPPAGFGELAKGVRSRTTLYEGPARDAVAKFPKNVNVAASLALAGLGFDETRVAVVADPALSANTHTIEARGAFGALKVEVKNRPFPENPATSHLAALAAIALVRKLSSPIWIGT